MTLKKFAEKAVILPSVIGSILTGHAWAARCRRDVIEKLARILGVPVIQIYLLAGFFRLDDFVVRVHHVDVANEAVVVAG